MMVFEGNKIVSAGRAKRAKMNKDQKMKRIRVKKEGEKRTKT